MHDRNNYLDKLGFYEDTSEKSTRKVVLATLDSYLRGDIDATVLSEIAREIVLAIDTHERVVKDADLLEVLDDAAELDYFIKTDKDTANEVEKNFHKFSEKG